MKNHFFFFFFFFLAQVPWAQEKPYNVLFIAVDDLNDYVKLLEDHPDLKTPNLDRFAESAITFSSAYTAAPACNPSRSAILTGLKPTETGLYENHDSFQKSKAAMAATLIPEHFKQNGYRTMWSGKIFHTGNLSHSRPEKERVAAMWDDARGSDGGYGPWGSDDRIKLGNRWFNYEEWEGPETDFPDIVNGDLTIERLQQKYDQPFFMAYGVYRPHTPWTAPKRFFDMYPIEDVQLPEVLENDLEDVPAIGKLWARKGVDIEELKRNKTWKHVVRAYMASVSFMDYSLGRVLDALENSPHADNTIVVLWADHGFHLGEKDHFTKFALWEQTTHTLLMAKVPGGPEGEVRDQPVNLLDMYPTLIDYCKLPDPDQNLGGESLRPVIEDATYEREKPSITYYINGSASMRTKDWRYIHYHNGAEELYDRNKDPKEWKNLANDPKYDKVKEEFSKWIPNEVIPRVGN